MRLSCAWRHQTYPPLHLRSRSRPPVCPTRTRSTRLSAAWLLTESMTQALVMPTTGEGVSQGTVLRWLKGVGDHVDRDEGLVEVETDTVNVEMPSPGAGT